MDIKHVGHSSFIIKTKAATIVTDPYSIEGQKYPSIDADIVTISHGHGDHNNSDAVKGAPLMIDMAGEYEKHGVRITGFPSFHDKEKGATRGKNVLYKIVADDVSILHCGDLGHTLSKDDIEAIGTVHILMVPVGGHYTIDSKEAVALIKDIEPNVVIPMHYNEAGLPESVFGMLTPVEEFVKAWGKTMPEVQEKLAVTKEMLTTEGNIAILASYGINGR